MWYKFVDCNNYFKSSIMSYLDKFFHKYLEENKITKNEINFSYKLKFVYA